MKRIFDLFMSSIGIVLLLPVYIVIFIWVKFDSKGDVFFRQERVGLHGTRFKILKFRTMIPDAESKGLKVTVGHDSRITKSGHFLRRSKIDELPQLFNVLIGDMSLVGPRPEVPEFIAEYSPEIRNKILSVKPGITDEASINFTHEAEILAKSNDPRSAYIKEVMPIKAQFYINYAEKNSVANDIVIILKTIAKIVR